MAADLAGLPCRDATLLQPMAPLLSSCLEDQKPELSKRKGQFRKGGQGGSTDMQQAQLTHVPDTESLGSCNSHFSLVTFLAYWHLP